MVFGRILGQSESPFDSTRPLRCSLPNTVDHHRKTTRVSNHSIHSAKHSTAINDIASMKGSVRCYGQRKDETFVEYLTPLLAISDERSPVAQHQSHRILPNNMLLVKKGIE
jgi:hypothetical protein